MVLAGIGSFIGWTIVVLVGIGLIVGLAVGGGRNK